MSWLLLLAAALLLSALVMPAAAGGGSQRVSADRERGFVGRESTVRLRAEFFLPAPAYWRLEWRGEHNLGLSPAVKSGFGWGGVVVEMSATAVLRRRGVHALPRARLFVRDALGLRSSEVRLTAKGGAITVYPRIWRQLPPDLALTLLAEGPQARQLGLEDASRYRGTREYHPGDSLKRIHWKATAHHDRLMVREFSWVRATGVWIYIDSGGASQVYLDHVAELSASLALRLAEQGLAVGLSWAGGSRSPARGDDAMRALLAELARLDAVAKPGKVPLPPAGVNLLVLTQEAPLDVIEGALAARARAARVHLLLFPEGFFLRPGETGRPVWGKTKGMERLQQKRSLLAAAGVYVHVFRGNEGVLFRR